MVLALGNISSATISVVILLLYLYEVDPRSGSLRISQDLECMNYRSKRERDSLSARKKKRKSLSRSVLGSMSTGNLWVVTLQEPRFVGDQRRDYQSNYRAPATTKSLMKKPKDSPSVKRKNRKFLMAQAQGSTRTRTTWDEMVQQFRLEEDLKNALQSSFQVLECTTRQSRR